MTRRSLAPQIIAITAVITFAGVLARGCSDWSPEHQASANATATSVSPRLQPTISYNRVVIPTIQAAEAREVVETVRTKAEGDRALARVWVTVRTIILLATGVGASVIVIAISGVAVAYAVKALKSATMLPARRWSYDDVVETSNAFHSLGSGAVGKTGLPQPADHRRLALNRIAQIELARVRVDAVRSKPRDEWTCVDKRVLMLEAQLEA